MAWWQRRGKISSQGSAGGVDVPGEPVVFGGVSGSCQVMTRRARGRAGSWRSRLPPWPGPPGLAAGQGGGSSSACGRLGQGGAGEPRACLSCSSGEWVRIAGARHRKPRGGCRKRSVPEADLIDDGTGAGGQLHRRRSRRRAPTRRSSGPFRPGGRSWRRVLSGVKYHRHLGRLLAAGGADRGVPGGQMTIMAGNCVTSGLSPGSSCQVSGIPPSRVTTRPGHQAQVGALLLGLPALGDRCALVAGIDEGGEVGHVQGDGGAVHAGRIDDGQRDRREISSSSPGRRRASRPEPAVIQRRRAIPVNRAGRRAATSRRRPAWSTAQPGGQRGSAR